MARLLKLARLLRWRLNLYGPYLGAGVRVRHIADDFSEIKVAMPLRWYNRNYVGTHFGGSLYSMTDPFFMLMLIQRLGPDYIVWDKAANIEFLRPGRGCVQATLSLDDERLEEVRANINGTQPYTPTWPVDVVDEQGKLVARVQKTLYVRRKKKTV